jgi:hypothetical protein
MARPQDIRHIRAHANLRPFLEESSERIFAKAAPPAQGTAALGDDADTGHPERW